MTAFILIRPISDNLKTIKSKGPDYLNSERELLFKRWVNLACVCIDTFITTVVPVTSVRFPAQSLSLLTELVNRISSKELAFSTSQFEHVLDSLIAILNVIERYQKTSSLLSKIETEETENLLSDTILAVNQFNKVLNQTHHE